MARIHEEVRYAVPSILRKHLDNSYHGNHLIIASFIRNCLNVISVNYIIRHEIVDSNDYLTY